MRHARPGAFAFIFTSILCGHPVLVSAFPPYRTTDADTADPRTLELRIGAVKVDWDRGHSEILSPLLRANLGIGGKFEIISELEYSPRTGELGDGALGAKWIPVYNGRTGAGIETLVLLPVRPGDRGSGIESQLVVTRRLDKLRLHLNAGGFHDSRIAPAQNGWRCSALVEFELGDWRPGLEIFAKQVSGEKVDMRLGAGAIAKYGKFDLRTGLHVGLTDKAPDVSVNLWFSTNLPF